MAIGLLLLGLILPNGAILVNPLLPRITVNKRCAKLRTNCCAMLRNSNKIFLFDIFLFFKLSNLQNSKESADRNRSLTTVQISAACSAWEGKKAKHPCDPNLFTQEATKESPKTKILHYSFEIITWDETWITFFLQHPQRLVRTSKRKTHEDICANVAPSPEEHEKPLMRQQHVKPHNLPLLHKRAFRPSKSLWLLVLLSSLMFHRR